MHELAVCQGLLEQVADIAQRHGGTTVTRIRVQVGPLSGVVPALLEQAFPVASAGTFAEGAELSVETLPVKVRCESCGRESEVAANYLVCACCGNWHTQLISGDELLLRDVELKASNE